MNNYNYNRLTPFKWFILENFPLIDEDFDALTNWQLFCKLGKEINKIIKSENDLGTQMESVTNAFIALQNYVDNYFDNLDVQDEINNKLDDMADSGELEAIISSYLQTKAVFAFDTVNDMINADNLTDGCYAKTLGFYSKNDKGGATYKIRNVTNDDILDGFSIIALNDSGNSLIAELIITSSMNLTQLGVHQDNETDDSNLLQNAINFASSKNIKLVGNYTPIIITKSIYIPAYMNIDNIYLKTSVSADHFTSGYMVGINTTNMVSWTLSYPSLARGILSNCKLENTNTSNMINGIFNFANQKFENIFTYKLNISFRTSSSYIDSVRIKGMMIDSKIGTDYALILGYLGDQCSFDTIHMAGTLGTPNFANIGDAHNPIYLTNIIANGKMIASHSQININNVHNELKTSNQFEFSDCQVNIENGYLNHTNSSDDYNIKLTSNSSLTLKNVLFTYDLNSFSYQNASDIDVNVSNNSSLTIIDSYKCIIKQGASDIKYKSSILTNRDVQPSLKNIKIYNSSTNSKPNNYDNWYLADQDVAYFQSTSISKWYESSGTYYYKIVPLLDKTRMISRYWNKTANAQLTNGSSGVGWISANSNTWRIYRGTSDGSYDKYVDVSNVTQNLIDNGYMLNGFKWKDRTAGEADTFLTGLSSLNRITSQNVIITGNFTTTPTVGTWTIGDIIYSTNASYTGWICTASGTPRNVERIIKKRV